MPSAPVLEAIPDNAPAIDTPLRLHVVPSPAPAPAEPTARIHWIGRFVELRHPADLHSEMLAGGSGLVVVDARFPEAYAREHLPGAISLPVRDLNEATAAHLSREAQYVVYCWDAACRASTKAAARLESLGFKVKELHGGLQAWKKQGYPTERG